MTIEVTVNDKEENSENFFLDFVQEFGLARRRSDYYTLYGVHEGDKLLVTPITGNDVQYSKY
jgi:hypothetical protein